MTTEVRRLFDLIEYKTGKKGYQIAEEEDMTQQNYSRMKRNGNKWWKYLVELKKKYDLTWDEVSKALEEDYE